MDSQFRLEGLAAEVQNVGVQGGDMQQKMAELIEQHDLSGNEIRRIAEMANRGTQMQLMKVAVDKRFVFKLVDPAPLVERAEKAARDSRFVGSGLAKTAAVINEAGGDPFAPLPAPAATPQTLSIYAEPLTDKYAHDLSMREFNEILFKLNKEHEDFTLSKSAGLAEKAAAFSKANDAFDRVVQSAADMTMSGAVTLPSMYYAMMAAISGSTVPANVVNTTDKFFLLVIDELLKRGISKARMGFKWQGDLAAIDKLSAEDLLALCKRSCGVPYEGEITMASQKTAQVYLQTIDYVNPNIPKNQMPYEEAAKFLGVRPSIVEDGLPSFMLDDKYNGNTPKGKPVVMNGDSEFIIAVKDLVGEQQRIMKLHNADEYLGLMLKQIQQAITGVSKARDEAAAKFAAMEAEEKKAFLAPALAGARALAGKAMGALTSPKGQAAIGLGTMGAALAPMVVPSADTRAQQKMMKQQAQPQPA